MEDIKFIKIRDVKSPERGTSEAAGIDFFIPWQSENFAADLKEKNPNIVLNFDTSQEEGKEDAESHVSRRLVTPQANGPIIFLALF